MLEECNVFCNNASMQFRKRTAVLLLIVIGIFLYSQVIHNDFILGDDEAQILNNQHVHSLTNIPQLFLESTYFNQQTNRSYGLFYRPVMLSSYAVLYATFGPNPGAFHLFQMLLHTSNAIIVFFIMEIFFPIGLAFMLALLFLVHPINSETVVHTANLQDLLFFFFGSLAFLVIIKNKAIITAKNLILFVAFLLLSVFSKETGALFGFISIVYSYLFNKKQLRKIVFCTVAVFLFYALFRFGIARVGLGESPISPIAHAAFAIRLLNIPAILLKYFYEFIFPLNLETAQLWIVKNVSMTEFFIPLFIIVILVISAILIGLKIAKKSKKNLAIYLFFSVWLFAGILLHIQFIPLDVTVAERWFYFPIVGLLGMLAIIYNSFFYKNVAVRKVSFIFFIGVIILFSFRTYVRILDWRNSETLFTHELRTNPHNFLIENYLGNMYMDDDNYNKARPLIADSVKQFPYIGNLNNMAILYEKDNNIKKANDYFLLSLQQGANYQVYRNYANFLFYIVHDDKHASIIATRGIQLYPTGSELFLVRAQAEYHSGNYRKALTDAKYANSLLPTKLSREVLTAIREKRDINLSKLIQTN